MWLVLIFVSVLWIAGKTMGWAHENSGCMPILQIGRSIRLNEFGHARNVERL